MAAMSPIVPFMPTAQSISFVIAFACGPEKQGRDRGRLAESVVLFFEAAAAQDRDASAAHDPQQWAPPVDRTEPRSCPRRLVVGCDR
jgi:hypothetical protein